MLRLRLLVLVVLALPLGLSSCVTLWSYRDLEGRASRSAEGERAARRRADSLAALLEGSESRNAQLGRSLERMMGDSVARARELQLAQDSAERLSNLYSRLSGEHSSLVAGNQRETSALLAELQKAQQGLTKRESALAQLQRDLDAQGKALQEARKAQQASVDSLGRAKRELASQRESYERLQAALAQRDSAAQALQRRIARSLFGFQKEGLTVELINGRVHIRLSESLMFASGSYKVDPRGAKALEGLATILAQNPDLEIVIEGHTDDVPLRASAAMSDNWDLSTRRATSIARLLLGNPGISPSRVTAAGRAQYLPIVEGKSSEARAQNRRTEIILTPRLSELMDLVSPTNSPERK